MSIDVGRIFLGASVLEVGANRGDVSIQILAHNPRQLTVTEIDETWCSTLKRRFKTDCVTVVSNDILNAETLEELDCYDVIVLKELLNALPGHTYENLFRNCESLLSGNGKIVIVDYIPLVIYRQFISSMIIRPWNYRKNMSRLLDNKRQEKTLTRASLSALFPDNQYELTYRFGFDLFNNFDSLLHKIAERCMPCKYVAVIKRLQ